MKPILDMQYIDSLLDLRAQLRMTNPAPHIDSSAAIDLGAPEPMAVKRKTLLARLRRFYAKA